MYWLEFINFQYNVTPPAKLKFDLSCVTILRIVDFFTAEYQTKKILYLYETAKW